jgi:hypothetical protein
MRKFIAIASLAAVAALFFVLQSCKKDKFDIVNEPITFVKPDTTRIRAKPGAVVPLEVKFTADRPIDFISGEVHWAQGGGSFTPGVDVTDSLFYFSFHPDSVTPNNKRTYTGTYTVGDTVQVFDVIRVLYKMKAGNKEYEKQLRIDVRFF